MASEGVAPYAPDYASYNWTGAPSSYDSLTTNELGGDSRRSLPLCSTGTMATRLTDCSVCRNRKPEQMVPVR